MGTTSRLLGWMGLFWVFVSPLLAEASGYREEARRLFLEGRALYGQSKPWDALIKYKAALGLLEQAEKSVQNKSERTELHVVRLGMECVVGDTYLSLKRWEEAFRFFKTCYEGSRKEQAKLAQQKGSLSQGDELKKVKRWEGKLAQSERLSKKGISALRPHLLGDIDIKSQPSGASVRLVDKWGGIVVGQTPFQKKVFAGRYRLILTLQGFVKIERQVVLQARSRKSLLLPLTASQASFSVTSTPSGARVVLFLRGAQVSSGRTPFQQSLEAGSYEVMVSLEGYVSSRFPLTLKIGRNVERNVILKAVKEPPPRGDSSSQVAPQRSLPVVSTADLLLYAKKKKEHQDLQFRLVLGMVGATLMGGGFLAWSIGRFGDPKLTSSEDTGRTVALLSTSILLILIGGGCAVALGVIKGPKAPLPKHLKKTALRGLRPFHSKRQRVVGKPLRAGFFLSFE